ncbi:PRTRC system protein E [Dechloromonas sp. CZR5]|uniref:PRTRC system protein E n=1 Tax=Dechloromonas sp. CZR5 TaxID=2608630 RepID=UPI00123D9864|nr:PRTRC system protein E [Dechloromonas sp. CZR5]
MTMFEEMFVLATNATLTMVLSADEKTGRMTINVIPKPKKDVNEPALTKALSLTATPAEFDAGFVDALKGYREVRQSLAEQAEATQEVLQAAKSASAKKAGEAMSKAVTVGDLGDGDAEEGGNVPQQAAATAASGAPYDLFG